MRPGFRLAAFLRAGAAAGGLLAAGVRHACELPPVRRGRRAAKPRAWDLLREPMFRRLLLVNWLLSSCWDVHTFVLPVLGHERGLSASVIGSILGAFAVAAAWCGWCCR